MIALANPANSGVANISSMIVPCIVNAWLNCSGVRICRPGRASSVRMSSASRPPKPKKMHEVIRYRKPMTLWSVEVIHLTTVEPGCRVRYAVTEGAGDHRVVDRGHQAVPPVEFLPLMPFIGPTRHGMPFSPTPAFGPQPIGSWPVLPCC